MKDEEDQGKETESSLRENNEWYRTLAEGARDYIFVIDSDMRVRYVNKFSAEQLGRVPEDVIGKPLNELIPPKVYAKQESDLRKVFESASPLSSEEKFDSSGKEAWIRTTLTPLKTSKGVVYAVMGIGSDITTRKEADKALEEKEHFLSSVFSSIKDGISVLDKDLNIIRVNPTMEEWYRHMGPIVGKKCYEAYHGRTQRCEICPTCQTLQTGKPAYEVVPKTGPDGEAAGWLDLYSFPLIDNTTGELAGVIEYVRDISERKFAEDALAASEANYRAIFDAANDAIFVLDIETFNVVDVNRKGCEMFCYSKEEIERIGMEALGAGEAAHLKEDALDRIKKVSRGEPQIFEWLAKDKAGRSFWAEVNLKRSVIGGKYRLLAIMRDINERKDVERRLEMLNIELLKSNRRLKHLSLQDPHTGLYNFRYLEEAIEAEFHNARRHAHPVSAIMFDIDYFKSINDVYGHQFGDVVLKQFARQIKGLVRRYDVVIRFGGEEFIIISPGTGKAEAIVLAKRLLDKINKYSFGNGKHSVKIKVSMAVTSYPADDNIVKGMDLINIADRILSKVKEDGGNRVYSLCDISKKKAGTFKGGAESAQIKSIKEKIEKQTRRGNQSLAEEMFAFAKTVESKDRYTNGHAEKLLRSVTELAGVLGLSNNQAELVTRSAALYDLGKIGISEKMLQKRAKLTKKEFEEVKKHAQIGADIISPIQSMRDIVPIVLYHHERWDGKGYPAGLKGDEIPLGARIISLADAYHALASDRPYRKAYSRDKAITIIKKESGTRFDPNIANTFINILEHKK